MSPLPSFEHVRPSDLDEALSMLEGDALPYHGGTELLAVMRIGLVRPGRLVDLKRVPELARLERAGGRLVIGGGVTHRQVAGSTEVRASAPLLAEVAEVVGNVRVRASGTVGGNLCFAEPKSDLATTLLALDADVTLRSRTGTRTLPLDEFLLGAYVVDLEPGELLTAVSVPVGLADEYAYRKFQTAERPTVGVAVVVSARLEPTVRIVIGAVAERPVIIPIADLDAVDPRDLAADLDVVEDLAGATDYKRHVTAVTVQRAIEDLRREDVA